MSLSKEQVKDIATLGRLALDDEELEKYSKDLSQILDYVEALQKVDTKDVEPMTGAIEFSHVIREDIVKKELDKSELLDNAPDTEDTAIKVPRMTK